MTAAPLRLPGAIFVALACVAALLVQRSASASATLPSGFGETVIASGLTAPTAFTFLPDGRVLIAEKSGVVRVVKNGSLLAAPFIDLSSKVNSYLDRGLLGIAADPQFASNGYVYLYYVYEPDANFPQRTKTARLTRVTATGDSASPSTETIILGQLAGTTCNAYAAGANCIPADYASHEGGDIEFASDGTLFLATGDAATPNRVSEDSLRSQNLDLLAGKLLRITKTGDGLPSNPFWNGDPKANRSRVWAYGLRNPFRFGLRPVTDRPYVGDVGWNDWEEVDVVRAGSNLGWPCYEGNAVQAGYQPQPTCQALYAQGPGAVVAPLLAYPRSTVIGGSFYEGSTYPAEYRGAYFYADYAASWIKYIRVDADDSIVSGPTLFASATDGPVDLKGGPGGDLYYLAINSGELRRIAFHGSNTPPSAVASANPTSGAAPLTVQFSSAGSTDADGDPLAYSWDFGDGAPASNAANPAHTYQSRGTYVARLTVTDGRGGSQSSTVSINAGNTAPISVISAPATTHRYKVGEVISLSGSANDAEDGTIPGSSLSWTVTIKHCPANVCHDHVLLTATGTTTTFTVPDHGDESHLEIELTATDSGGLTGTASREIHPQTIQITLAADPPVGITLVYDGQSGTAPLTRTTPVGSTHTIFAPSPQGGAVFSSWSDGGAQQHNVTAGTANATYTATFTTANTTTLKFPAEADARVHQQFPTSSYAAQDLRTIGGAGLLVESYLRFRVSGVMQAVQSARLRLLAYTGTVDGPRLFASGTAWSEKLTWNTRPTALGGPVDDKGAIAAKTWVEYDVTSLVSGDGTYSFGLSSSSTDAVDFYSREDAKTPELVVVMSGDSDATPPAAPAGLTASASAGEISLDWSDNTEADLDGYNVYRSSSPSGTFTRLNAALLASSSYDDTTALVGEISYYRVTALDTAGNESAPATTNATRPAQSNEDFDGFVTDAACASCSIALVGSRLEARIAGGADDRDTAYAFRDFGGAGGAPGRILASTDIGLGAGQTLGGNLVVFQILDVGNKLVFDLTIGSDRKLILWSPAGGLRATSISKSLTYTAPNNGSATRRVQVSALRNDSIVVTIDGIEAFSLAGLTGATTGNPRFVRVGILRYAPATVDEPVFVHQAGITVT